MNIRDYVDELIKMVNLVRYDEVIPDFATEVENRVTDLTKTKVYKYDSISAKRMRPIIFETWNKANKSFRGLTEYAENSHMSIFGVGMNPHRIFLFSKPQENRSSIIYSAEEVTKNPSLLKGLPFHLQLIGSTEGINVKIINADLVHVVDKLENLIRLVRVIENMRLVAHEVRNTLHKEKYKKKYKTFLIDSEFVFPDDWKDEYYDFIVKRSRRFTIETNSRNNKIIGKLIFPPSPVQWALSQIDVLQIKTCERCRQIFFAEPRNMKYCSQQCNNRQKSKRHYHRKKNQKSL
jgi:hypothetical protein